MGSQGRNLRTTHHVLGPKHFDNVKRYSLTLKCPPQVRILIVCHLAGAIVLEPLRRWDPCEGSRFLGASS